jgi:hypothetical protein
MTAVGETKWVNDSGQVKVEFCYVGKWLLIINKIK